MSFTPVHGLAHGIKAIGIRWLLLPYLMLSAFNATMAYGAGNWVNTKTTNTLALAICLLVMGGIGQLVWTIWQLWQWEETAMARRPPPEARESRIQRLEKEIGIHV